MGRDVSRGAGRSIPSGRLKGFTVANEQILGGPGNEDSGRVRRNNHVVRMNYSHKAIATKLEIAGETFFGGGG